MSEILTENLKHWMTTRDVDELASCLSAAESDVQGKVLSLDLRQLKWIDLLPFAYLRLWLHDLGHQRKKRVSVLLPPSLPADPQEYARLPRACPQRVSGFLAKWGLGECFEHENIRPLRGMWELQDNDPRVQDLAGENPSDENLYLGPSCLLRTLNDVEVYTKDLDSPGGLFHSRAQTQGALTDSQVAEHAFLLVEELGRNIFDHNTESVVGVACHRLIKSFEHAPNRRERETARQTFSSKWEQSFFEYNAAGGYLEFVVGDNGKGIAETLSNQGTAKGMTDPIQLLTHAFERFSSRRQKLTTRMRGLFCVLQNLRHVHGTLFIVSNGVALSWSCPDGRIQDPTPYRGADFRKGSFFQVLIPLRSTFVPSVKSYSDKIAVSIPIVPQPLSIQPLSLHSIWWQVRSQPESPLPGISGLVHNLREILENPKVGVAYVLNFAGFDWSREQCHEVLKPLIAAWRRRVPFVMINVSRSLWTHMQYSGASFLYEEYHCVLPILDSVPRWIGLDEGLDSDKQIAQSLTKCVDLLRKGATGSNLVTFLVDRKDYAGVPVLCRDNPTLFNVPGDSDFLRKPSFCLDVLGLDKSFGDSFEMEFKDYLRIILGVVSREPDCVYELPGGGYTDVFVDLRGIFINNPFATEVCERIADLVAQESKSTQATKLVVHGEVGSKLLTALKHKEIDLDSVELGGWRDLASLRTADYFDDKDRVIILTDVIGLGTAVHQVATRVRSRRGEAVAVVAILDAREAQVSGLSVDDVPVRSLVKMETNHWLNQPENKNIIRFNPQKGPFELPTTSSIPQDILSSSQFWSLVQRTRALHVGHRSVNGRRLRLHISSRKLAEDSVSKRYLTTKIREFSDRAGGYDFVLHPSKQQSPSAFRFRDILESAIPKAQIVSQEHGCRELITEIQTPRVLLFDYGTLTGRTLLSLLNNVPAGATVDILVLLDRMQTDDWRIVKWSAPDMINRIAAFYRIPSTDTSLLDESDLAARGERVRHLESWTATHRMLEYLEEHRETLLAPMETETETDEAEPSAFSSVPVSSVHDIDTYASRYKSTTSVSELISLLLTSNLESLTSSDSGMFDEQIQRGIARDLCSRISDPVIVLELVSRIRRPELRSELLDAFFLEHSAAWPWLEAAVANHLEPLLSLGERTESLRELETITRVIARLSKSVFLRNLVPILKYSQKSDRLLCAVSHEVARFLASDRATGTETSDAVRLASRQILAASPMPVSKDGLSRFLENIGFATPSVEDRDIHRLRYGEFFDKMVQECFPAEVICLYLTDYLVRRFGADCKASVWRFIPDRNELRCIAASPLLGEGRVYTQVEGRLTGIPVSKKKRDLLIKDVGDSAEIVDLGLTREMVSDFSYWAKSQKSTRSKQPFKSLSLMVLRIEGRYGLFGVCRVMRLWRNSSDAFSSVDFDWLKERLSRFRQVTPEYGAARRDLAFASRLGRQFAKIAATANQTIRQRIDSICEFINDSLGVKWCSVVWLDTARDALVRCGTGGSGWSEEARHRVLEHDKAKYLSWRVMETQKLDYSPDVRVGPKPTSPPMDTLRSCISLPLIRESNPCGVLTLWSDLVEGLSMIWADRAWLDLIALQTTQAVGLIRREEEIAQHQRRLYERARDEMILNVSHSVRNDLSPARLSAGTALACTKDLSASTKQSEVLSALERTDQHLEKLNRHLEQMTHRTREFECESEAFNLHRLIQESVSDALPSDATFILRCPQEIKIVGDKYLFGWVFSQLAANASEAKPVGLTFEVTVGRSTSSDREYFQVLVQDNGPGIPPGHERDVFELFWQGDSNRRGVGLGLYRVKRIVEAHRGSIDCERRASGACFRLVVPTQSSKDGDYKG